MSSIPVYNPFYEVVPNEVWNDLDEDVQFKIIHFENICPIGLSCFILNRRCKKIHINDLSDFINLVMSLSDDSCSSKAASSVNSCSTKDVSVNSEVINIFDIIQMIADYYESEEYEEIIKYLDSLEDLQRFNLFDNIQFYNIDLFDKLNNMLIQKMSD